MLVTLLPMVTLVRLVHSSNAPYPTLVTLLGMATLVRLVHTDNSFDIIQGYPTLSALAGYVYKQRRIHLHTVILSCIHLPMRKSQRKSAMAKSRAGLIGSHQILVSIGQHLARPGKRSLRIHDPFLTGGLPQQSFVGTGPGYGRKLPMKLQLPIAIELLKPGTELSTKHLRQSPHRK